MLIGSAVIGAVASAVLAVAAFVGAPLWMVYLSMALMGAYSGASNPATESLFADSVQTGARSAPLARQLARTHMPSTANMLAHSVIHSCCVQ